MISLVTFQGWVEDLISRRFGTATALAKEIGMELSPFTRGVASGTLNIFNLLKLAKVADERPSVVLRLAGKDGVADLIESVYGSDADLITTSERELLAQWRHLDQREQDAFRVLIRDLTKDFNDHNHTTRDIAS
jgi:hypothetical protein